MTDPGGQSHRPRRELIGELFSGSFSPCGFIVRWFTVHAIRAP
jgi:hypothetical protein